MLLSRQHVPGSVKRPQKSTAKTPARNARAENQFPIRTPAQNLKNGTAGGAPRLFLDRTPFPNQKTIPIHSPEFQTPLPEPKFKAIDFSAEPGLDVSPDYGGLRPSSLRAHFKSPRQSLTKVFQTPLNTNPSPWAEDVSTMLAPETTSAPSAEEEDFEEIEYMPPNTLDLPYQPPFDFELPDYTEAGRALFNFARTSPDTTVEISEATFDDLSNLKLLNVAEVPSDDIFREIRGKGNLRAVPPVARSNPPLSRPSKVVPTRPPVKSTFHESSVSQPMPPRTSARQPTSTTALRLQPRRPLSAASKTTRSVGVSIPRPVTSVRPRSVAAVPVPRAAVRRSVSSPRPDYKPSSSSSLRNAVLPEKGHGLITLNVPDRLVEDNFVLNLEGK